jgi:hypothetical protein
MVAFSAELTPPARDNQLQAAAEIGTELFPLPPRVADLT